MNSRSRPAAAAGRRASLRVPGLLHRVRMCFRFCPGTKAVDPGLGRGGAGRGGRARSRVETSGRPGDLIRKSLPGGLHVSRAAAPVLAMVAPCGEPKDIFLIATLIGLSQLQWATSLPVPQPEPSMPQCLTASKNLVEATNEILQKSRKILELYPCSLEEIDHEDITKGRSDTVRACLPPEFIKVEMTSGFCFPLQKNFICNPVGQSLITNVLFSDSRTEVAWFPDLCLRSIYEDLETYKAEFNVIKKTLTKDPAKQISVDLNMLAAIEEMMQALNFNSKNVPLISSPKESDFYKTKVKLCVLLHAFRTRTVTIDRMMNYLAPS
ncbi:interleukin-12 subunit alpha [Monodelphis domestica]|uniref:interleukin-12 subunit alpha n=1 Tax=Monodelphis domestica TaxID=13616 RepID=UPI0024E25B7A|nr:interleukin-12 subunit alpha [Monodelphis domestica]